MALRDFKLKPNNYFMFQFIGFAVVCVTFATILFYFLFNSYTEKIEKERNADIEIQLNNLSRKLNSMLEAITLSANNIYMDDSINGLNVSAFNNPMLYKELMAELIKEKSKNPYIISILVYFNDSFVLTNLGSMEFSTFFNSDFIWKADDEAWIWQVNANNELLQKSIILKGMEVKPKYSTENNNVTLLPIVFSLNNYFSARKFTMFVDISNITDELDLFLDKYNSYALSVADLNGTSIIHYQKGTIVERNMKSYDLPAGNSLLGRFHIRLKVSHDLPFIMTKGFATGLFMTILLASLTISYIIARIIYKPVKTLLNLLSHEYQLNLNNKNELQDIIVIIDNLALNKKQIERELEMVKNAELIKDIILGRFGSCPAEHGNVEIDINFPHPHFKLLMIRADVFDRIKTHLVKSNHLIGISFLYMDNAVLLMINYSHEQDLTVYIDEMFILNEYDKKVVIYTSDEYSNIYLSNAALFQIKQAMNYYPLSDSQLELIPYGNIKDINIVGNMVPADKEIELANNLKAGNTEVVIQLLQEIIYNRNESKFVHIKILNDLTFILYKLMNDLGITPRFLADHAEPFTLPEENSFHEFTIDKLLKEAEKLCHHVISTKESSNTEVVKQIIDYIDNNYFKDFSIDELADEFGMSYKYLSRYFKDQTGINVTDYINMIRIKEAKKMLEQDKQYKVLDVCKLVGYANVQTFRRNFKKFEGITPGDI